MSDETLRDKVELALLTTNVGPRLAENAGKCVDLLLEEGILDGSESALEAVNEIILQAIAEGP